jgi:hypothetical protein
MVSYQRPVDTREKNDYFGGLDGPVAPSYSQRRQTNVTIPALSQPVRLTPLERLYVLFCSLLWAFM